MPQGLWQPRTNTTGNTQPWRCRVTLADGRRVVVSTRQKELGAARESYKRLQRAAARGEPLWGACPALLRPVLDAWVASRRLSRAPATADFYEAKADRLVEQLGAACDCNRLTLDQLEAYIGRRRAAGTSDASVLKELGTLRAALRRARRAGVVTLDIERVWPEFRAEYVPRKRWLQPDEFEKLLGELPAARRPLVELLVYTGARDAEWKRLEARHINWRERVLELPGSKTTRAPRAIPFAEHPALAELLRERSRARIGGKLFPKWTNLRRDLGAACERAKIPHCSPNDLRRTFATWLRIAGVEVDRIARLLGHANSRLVERVYGQLPAVALAGDVGRGFAYGLSRGAINAPVPLQPHQLEQAMLQLLGRIHGHATQPEALS